MQTALTGLAKRGVARVIATGRNLYSTRKVLSPDFPFDYLIFSGGAGILHWQSGEILHAHSLPAATVQATALHLKAGKYDFMIQAPIPENHHFQYFRSRRENEDFAKRCAIYAGFHSEWNEAASAAASQIIVIEPEETGVEAFGRLQAAFPQLSVVRTTSPLDKRSVWIEIAAAPVSKGNAAGWLADHLKISRQETLAVGNDFNDLSLLEWSAQALVVENAPAELKAKYATVPSHDQEGVRRAIEDYLTA